MAVLISGSLKKTVLRTADTPGGDLRPEDLTNTNFLFNTLVYYSPAEASSVTQSGISGKKLVSTLMRSSLYPKAAKSMTPSLV